MAPARAIPVPPARTARTSAPVRIFSVGQPLPSGATADEAFVDAVARNWDRHQAKGDPRFPKPPAFLIPAASVSLGHEHNSSIARAYAERSDLPAVGWPAGRVYRDGPHLYAERLEGVPVKLAEWVNAGAYKHVSAEFYEDFEGYGPTLRRIAFLGADVPACKDLGPIPTLVFDPAGEADRNPLAFTERLARFAAKHKRFGLSLAGRPVCTFSESTPGARPMTPQQQAILDALTAAGVDTSKLDGAALDAIAAACAGAITQPGPPGPTPPAMNAEDEEKKMAAFSERMAKAVTAAVSPLQAKIDALTAQQQVHATQLAAERREKDRAAVAAFCEQHKDKIFPFEMDAEVAKANKSATLVDQILSQPADAVATFAEGQVSPRAAFMAAIAARPPVAKFAERLANPQPGPKDDLKAETDRLLGLTPTGKAAKALAAAK